MRGEVYIISSDASLNKAQVVNQKLLSSGFDAEILTYNRTSKKPDLFPKPSNINNVDIVEKYYLKDENYSAAGIIRVQKKQLEEMLLSISPAGIVYVCEEHIPEFFFIRKFLYRNSFNFFSFGNIIDDKTLSLHRATLDIGTKLDTDLKMLPEEIDNHGYLSEFKGYLAIDPPPDSIPYSHLGYFRSPKIFTNALISFLDFYYKKRRHPEIKIIAPQKPASCYEISKRADQIIEFLGKRCKIIESTSEIEKGSTVITWSTKQFFSLRSEGFLSLPATKCGASFLFRKSKGVEKLILDRHSQHETDNLERFYRKNSISY
jgi:hypothetical protein